MVAVIPKMLVEESISDIKEARVEASPYGLLPNANECTGVEVMFPQYVLFSYLRC